MKTRDQHPGADDPTNTVRLDDSYRVRIMGGSESVDSTRAARPDVAMPSSSTGSVPLQDQYRDAESALDRVLTEFKTAAAAVIDRIKAGDCLPKAELDREWTARIDLIKARKLVERLDRKRNAIAAQKRAR